MCKANSQEEPGKKTCGGNCKGCPLLQLPRPKDEPKPADQPTDNTDQKPDWFGAGPTGFGGC